MIDRVCSLLRMNPPIVDNRGMLFSSGATVPTDGTDGYQTGCIFQHTDGGAETALYVNEGSVTSCDFNAVIPPGSMELSDLGDVGSVAYAAGTLLTADGDSYEEVVAACTRKVIETGTYSSTASNGVTLLSTNNRPVSFLFDDAGAALGAADYRAALSRVLLTKDQSNAITLNAMRAQIKGLDGIDVSSASSVVSPFTGYLELAGTGARTLNGHVACVRAALEEGASGTTTVGTYLAGFEATLNSTRTYGGSGITAAFLADISSGTSSWQYGLYVGLSGADVILGSCDAFTGKVVQTGTYSSSASKGVTLASGNNRPVSFLFDDAGAALDAADYRATLSRVCLTIDQSNAITINALRGQLKANDGIDISNTSSVSSPITGYLELAGTGARTLAGHVAGIRAAIEEGASGTTTISASSYYSGFEATLNSTRTYTETGEMAAFMANISGGTTKWPKAFWADAAGCTTGIYVGKHANTAGSGISLGGATAANRFHSDDGGSALTGNRRGVLSRLAVIAEHTGALSLASMCAQTKLVGDVDFDGDYLAGMYAYLEMAGANDLGLNDARHAACAVRARTEVGGDLTIAQGYLAGVYAELNTTGAYTVTQTGVLAAFVATATDQRGDLWGSALYVDGADNVLGFAAADSGYTNGIKANAVTPTGNVSHVIRVDINGTPGYIPVYAAEGLGT